MPRAPVAPVEHHLIVANNTGLDSSNVTVATSKAIIKSVRRTFEILEYFERTERPASLTAIARALSLPISSTSMLMHSLTAMGYVTFVKRTREFVPTMRVSMLGAWIQQFLFSDLDFASVMASIHARCGHTIMAGYLNGLYAQYVHVIQGTTPVRYYLAPGSSRLAVRSTLGIVLLSTLSDKQIENIWTHARLNLEGAVQPKLSWLKNEIERARQDRYALTSSLGTKGVGVIAAMLPRRAARIPRSRSGSVGQPTTSPPNARSWSRCYSITRSRYADAASGRTESRRFPPERKTIVPMGRNIVAHQAVDIRAAEIGQAHPRLTLSIIKSLKACSSCMLRRSVG